MQDKDGVIQTRFICRKNYKKLKENILQMEDVFTMEQKISFERIDLFELVKNRRNKNGR